MSTVPLGLKFEPVAQLDRGLVAHNYDNIATAYYYISGVGVVTFGFIVGDFWARCGNDETTSWTACSDESTSWTGVSNETTTWSLC